MKNKFIKLLSAVVLFLTVVLSVLLSSCGSGKIRYSNYEFNELLSDSEIENILALSGEPVEIEGIVSKNAIIYDMTDSKILSIKNAFEVVAPASLTKIMTAIISIEMAKNLNEKIVISSDMFDYIEEQNASVAGFAEYEVLTIRDLLYGIMLPSGADAAIALADHFAGSESNFAELMNKKAEEIGCYNTHFVNVTGLDAAGHYSTAYDICKILCYAYENAEFREIFSSASYTVPPTNKHEKGLTLKSTVFETMKNNEVNTNYLIGGKTGYTYDAGLCLAAVTRKDGNLYCTVTLRAGDGKNKPSYNVTDYQFILDNYL